MTRQFVTAFAGRRDAYQVPLALAEAGRLARFVTTFYLTKRVERFTQRILPAMPAAAARRRSPGVDDALVRPLLSAELLEQLSRRIGLSPRTYWRTIDRAISRAAGREAVRTGADLFLYEPYARHAFEREYPGFRPRKILFHFHPHPDFETAILSEDLRRHPPRCCGSVDAGVRPLLVRDEDSRHAWKQADLILCASSLTRRSLLQAGAAAGRCRVIPYGVDAQPEPPVRRRDGEFRAVFVGSGTRRKGLHHLLEAWRIARLPARSKLVLVCRTIDPPLRVRAHSTARCRLVGGLNQAALERLYDSASVFVMPSLVEGFGQVYLEALARGCLVLGTANTGLPDLGGEADGVFLAEPSNVANLAEMLERLAAGPAFDRDLSQAAWRTAANHSWARFRAGVMEAVA